MKAVLIAIIIPDLLGVLREKEPMAILLAEKENAIALLQDCVKKREKHLLFLKEIPTLKPLINGFKIS
jgi:hypothetical protein